MTPFYDFMKINRSAFTFEEIYLFKHLNHCLSLFYIYFEYFILECCSSL